jgi:hypothetical protein
MFTADEMRQASDNYDKKSFVCKKVLEHLSIEMHSENALIKRSVECKFTYPSYEYEYLDDIVGELNKLGFSCKLGKNHSECMDSYYRMLTIKW